MIQAIFFIVMRWIHLLSMTMIVGGITMFVLSATPLGKLERNETIDKVIAQIEKRYRLLMMISVLGLIVSGVYQWVAFGIIYHEHMAVLVVLSFKVLVATTLFALLWGMHVDTMSGEKAKAWRWTNLSLAVTVLVLAGVVRYLRLQVTGG